MKIVAISMVRNEADIVEAFVRHTAALADAHLILDDGSTDSTPDILQALLAEGLPLTVEREDTPGYFQAERMSRLMKRAGEEMRADWVIPLDADEFLVPTGRRLRRLLKGVHHPILIRWRTQVPSDGDDREDPNPTTRLKYRLERESRVWCKVAVPGSLTGRALLDPGNHDLTIDGISESRPILDGAWLCHLPIRDPQQFAAKVAIGVLQYAVQGNPPGLGFHYLAPFEDLRRGWSVFEAEYLEHARRFALQPEDPTPEHLVRDPVEYAGGPLRYTRPQRDSHAMLTILEYAMNLATTYGELMRQAGSTQRE